MAIAHVCPRCGHDLSRVRSGLDAVYSLPVVACACGYACIRRRHPLSAGLRQARRIALAVGALVVQSGAAALLALTIAVLAVGMEQELAQRRSSWVDAALKLVGTRPDGNPLVVPWFEGAGVVALTVWMGLSVAAGGWMGLTLRHWRPGTALAVWWGLLVLAFSAGLLTWPLRMVPVWWQGVPARYDAVGAADWVARVAIATLSVALAGLGLRAALLVDQGSPAGRARRLGRRRVKLRRLRRGV